MMKTMIFLRRRSDMSRAAFLEWWLQHHRGLAERLPGLRRHSFNLLPAEAPFDAVVEQWFDSAEAARSAYLGEIGRAVAADSLEHVSERMRLEVEEHDFPLVEPLDTATSAPSNK
jgi:uncharacterized protein (TIGR02118 family)